MTGKLMSLLKPVFPNILRRMTGSFFIFTMVCELKETWFVRKNVLVPMKTFKRNPFFAALFKGAIRLRLCLYWKSLTPDGVRIMVVLFFLRKRIILPICCFYLFLMCCSLKFKTSLLKSHKLIICRSQSKYSDLVTVTVILQ